MDEPAEDLEPLFDYSRVQPNYVCLDDDDPDTPPIFNGGKRKRTDTVDVKGKGMEKAAINLDDDEEDKMDKEKDDEDWLPSPPKISNRRLMFHDDKTIQELRLKKQELATFAESAKEVLKSAMESAKREINNSAEPEIESEVELPPKKQAERPKIVISIQDKDGQKTFRVYSDDKFERLFKMYAEKVKVGMDRLVFSFDGDKVSQDGTPQDLGMEDEDMLEVRVKPQ